MYNFISISLKIQIMGSDFLEKYKLPKLTQEIESWPWLVCLNG